MADKETPAWVLLGKYAGVMLLFAGPVFVGWVEFQFYRLRKYLE